MSAEHIRPKLPRENWLASILVLIVAMLFVFATLSKAPSIIIVVLLGLPCAFYSIAVISALCRVELGRKAATLMTTGLGILLLATTLYGVVEGNTGFNPSSFVILLVFLVFVRNFTSDGFKAYCAPPEVDLNSVFE